MEFQGISAVVQHCGHKATRPPHHTPPISEDKSEGQGQAEDVSRSTICMEPALALGSVDGSHGIT